MIKSQNYCGGGYISPSIVEASLSTRVPILNISITNGDNTVEGFITDEGNVIEE